MRRIVFLAAMGVLGILLASRTSLPPEVDRQLHPSVVPDAALRKLRADLAQRYVEPAPHMALARHFHRQGDRLQAFYLVEHARRNLFPSEPFDRAYRAAFVDQEPFDDSPASEAALLEKLAKSPDSVDLNRRLADVYISRGDWPQAKTYLTQVIRLEPAEYSNVAALAEVLSRQDAFEEGESLIQDFLERYPESSEGYHARSLSLLRSQPEEARQLLLEAARKFPNVGGFLFNLGVLSQDEGKLAEAEDYFVRAAALSQNAHLHGWLGRFYLKAKMPPDQAKSLEYYLNAYFLDPHFRDSEHAEQRIRVLGDTIARTEYERQIAAGKKPVEVLGDKSRSVVGLALADMKQAWEPGYIPALMDCLSHDDEMIRYRAMHLLLDHVDRSFDPQLNGLLADPDLRRRGIGGYLAIKLWGQAGIDQVSPWLKEEAQLLRYDAISALMEHGGAAGMAIILEHQPREKHPWMQGWLKVIEEDEKKEK